MVWSHKDRRNLNHTFTWNIPFPVLQIYTVLSGGTSIINFSMSLLLTKHNGVPLKGSKWDMSIGILFMENKSHCIWRAHQFQDSANCPQDPSQLNMCYLSCHRKTRDTTRSRQYTVSLQFQLNHWLYSPLDKQELTTICHHVLNEIVQYKGDHWKRHEGGGGGGIGFLCKESKSSSSWIYQK